MNQKEQPVTSPKSRATKKVLMIAYRFPPTNESGSIRPGQFAKHLINFGYQPIVITYEGFDKVATDMVIDEEIEKHCRIYHIRPLTFGYIGKFLGWCISKIDAWLLKLTGRTRCLSRPTEFLWNKIWKRREITVLTLLTSFWVLATSGFSIVWATGPPWGTLHIAYVIAFLMRKPLVTDVRDPWTYDEGFLHVTNMEGEKVWERRILAYSTRIVYTSPLTTDIMKKKVNHLVAKKMITITNGFDDRSMSQIQSERGDKCVFTYVGGLFPFRNPSSLFQGLKILCQNEEVAQSVHFRFVGRTGGYDSDLSKYGLERMVEFLGLVSFTRSLEFMRTADVLILIQTISGAGSDVIGGKTYEYLANRKPILGVVDDSGGDAWLLNSTGGGIVVGNSDPERIAKGIERYWALWKENRLHEEISSTDLSRYSRRNLTKDLAALFDEVLLEM